MSQSETSQEQKDRVLKRLDMVVDPVSRYSTLAALQDRNETLFYNILIENIRSLGVYLLFLLC